MAVIHVTEAEAARDLPSLLAKVATGEYVQIDRESNSFLIVSIRGPQQNRPRMLSDVLASMEKNASDVKLDDQWGADLDEVIRLRQHEILRNPWESY